MGRRSSSGRVGAPSLGGIIVSGETITSDNNRDIIIDPTGSGRVLIEAHMQVQNQNELRFGDSDDSHYVGFSAPATVSSDVTWVLPNADATAANQVLASDAAGTLSFIEPFVTVSDETLDSNTNYVVFTDQTSGGVNGFEVSSTQLTFQPSTGTLSTDTLTVTAGTASTTTGTGALVVTGGVGIGGQLTANSIVETSSIAYKDKVNTIDSALEKICNLRGVTYLKDNQVQAGLIAEEVLEILPLVVARDENNKVHGIAYTKIIAYLIESIKELRQKIKD